LMANTMEYGIAPTKQVVTGVIWYGQGKVVHMSLLLLLQDTSLVATYPCV